MNFLKKYNIYLLAIVLAILINVFSWHLPFFWDTILTSTITEIQYHTGFIIPLPEYDAGHPPLFYIYLVWFYYLIDMNLFTAHLSILPFTILGIISFIKLLYHFSFSKQQQFIGVILFFAIPAVITQNTLVSYDAVLMSLYLTALVSYFKDKKILFALILIGIVGITLRGLFCLAALSITIYFLENRNIKFWFKWNLYFVPAIILISSWYIYHYTQTGWFFATKSEGWSEQRGFVKALGLFKNGISIARCFFDLGIFILSFLSLFYLIKNKKVDKFTLLWLIPSIIFSLSFLLFTNPINHRYFLIVYVLMLIPVIQFLSERKIIFTVFTTLILLLGHFQIYPVPVSNGWDCTLQYRNYTQLKDEFELYLIKTNIIRDSIGTVFPMNTSLLQTKMVYSNKRMINVNGKSIDSIQYLLFSNIGNDFSDEHINTIKSWKVLYHTKSGLVQMILYENPIFKPK